MVVPCHPFIAAGMRSAGSSVHAPVSPAQPLKHILALAIVAGHAGMFPVALVPLKHWSHEVASLGHGGSGPPRPAHPSYTPVQSVKDGPHFGKPPVRLKHCW